MKERFKQYQFQAHEVVLNCTEGPPAGPPILLLHGMCDRWQGLLPVAEFLSPRWQVHTFDLRGHGMSGRVPKGYLPQDYCRDAEEFLSSRFDEPAVLFGHSAGGFISLCCAASHPERVRAVINGDLFGSSERLSALIQRPESVAFYKELQSLAGQTTDRIATSSQASHQPSTTLTEWAMATSLLDPATLTHHVTGDGPGYVEAVNMDAILDRVKCPVLLISGDLTCGGVMSVEDVNYACDRLVDARHVRLDGVGHGLGLSTARPELLLQAIDDFLTSLQ